jgi:hypothetical protein
MTWKRDIQNEVSNVRFRLFCDWRSVGQSVLDGGPWPDFYYCRTYVVFMLRGALPDERPGMWFTPTVCCPSPVHVSQNFWPYLTVSYESPATWRARSLYLYPPGTGWPSYTPRALGSLGILGIPTRLHTGLSNVRVRVHLAADRQSTSSSGYRASLWDPWPDFIFLFFFRLTVTLFFLLRCPLWRENGSVVYNAITHWSQ